MADYDVVLIGGGPAGLTAGIYTSRAGLKTLLLEKAMPGGQILASPHLENYPGFAEGVSGGRIISDMVKQASRFGLEIKTETVYSIEDRLKSDKFVKTGSALYKALTVILAMGASYAKIDVPGEERLNGYGVSYCATCDGPLFRNKEVVVVGGGDTAIEEALFLSNFCVKVNVIHRRSELRAVKVLRNRAFANKKINFVWDTVVTEISGEQKVESVRINNVKTGQEAVLPASGVFIAAGFVPHTEIVKGLVNTDEKGYIITGDDMAASREGFFAAGDCRKKLLRQFVTACGDGATAAYSAQKYVENLNINL